MRFYQIMANVRYRAEHGVWTGSKSLPTFILSASTHGITDNNHARKIARHILQDANPALLAEDITIHVDNFEIGE